MKALRSHRPGGPEALVLDDLPLPLPGAGEVRIAVRAAGLNFLDTLIIRDLYQRVPDRPFTPGAELSGVIDAVGEGVTRWKAGDRVACMLHWGALAEYAVVAEDQPVAIPASLDFASAAGLLLTYGTAIHSLKDRAALRPGETLLVLGAGGGAGLAAVDLGKAMGARVIAAVSSEDKARAAREAGADDVVLYGRAPFDRDASRALAGAFKAACGPGGADVVFDAVGGDYAEPALRATAWMGRYLVIGFAAGVPRIPLNLVLLSSRDVRGVVYGEFRDRQPEHNAGLVAELFDHLAAGRISPRIGATYPFDRAGEALAQLGERKAIGKIVVRIGD